MWYKLKNWRFKSMDVRCGFILNNLQSNREKDFNARQMREQVNPKSLPILFEVYYLKSILEPYLLAVTLSMLKKETKPYLKLESSLILSYPSS